MNPNVLSMLENEIRSGEIKASTSYDGCDNMDGGPDCECYGKECDCDRSTCDS